VKKSIGNQKEFEVFLLSYEVELEKALKVLKDARNDLVKKQEANQ
jgi:hypothetical protein